MQVIFNWKRLFVLVPLLTGLIATTAMAEANTENKPNNSETDQPLNKTDAYLVEDRINKDGKTNANISKGHVNSKRPSETKPNKNPGADSTRSVNDTNHNK